MRLRNHLATVLLLTVGISASPAAAETVVSQPDGTGEGPIADAAPRAGISWYGYQTLALDATAVALVFVANEKNSTALGVGAIGIYMLGAPSVHAVHDRPLATVGSLALRIFLPLISSAVAAASADCSTPVYNDENCDIGPRVMGLVFGIAAAVVIDSAAIAWERRAPSPPPNRSSPRATSSPTGSLSLAPVPIRDGAGLLLSGLF